jgi:hypothetical protein
MADADFAVSDDEGHQGQVVTNQPYDEALDVSDQEEVPSTFSSPLAPPGKHPSGATPTRSSVSPFYEPLLLYSKEGRAERQCKMRRKVPAAQKRPLSTEINLQDK